MFNEITLKDMETIDKLVSKKTKELFKSQNKLFLSWTFPTNHLHEHQSLSSNYFAIWVGESGKGLLKLVCFGGVWMIPELLEDVTEEKLKKILYQS